MASHSPNGGVTIAHSLFGQSIDDGPKLVGCQGKRVDSGVGSDEEIGQTTDLRGETMGLSPAR